MYIENIESRFQSIIADWLEIEYEKAKVNKKIIYEGIPLYEGDNNEELSTFHYKKTITINKDDDYLCGIRANTLVVSFGFTEWNFEQLCVLVQGNHKGNIAFTAFYIDDQFDIRFDFRETENDEQNKIEFDEFESISFDAIF